MNLYKLHSKPETLDHYDVAFEKVPALVWEKYKGKPAELKKREKILAKDSKTAYLYARHILKGPFPAGEAAIAKNTEYAYFYAYRVLKKPFPAGEVTIAKDPKYAYLYAHDVLDGPFQAGEATITKDPLYAFTYARYVLYLSVAKAQKWSGFALPRVAKK